VLQSKNPRNSGNFARLVHFLVWRFGPSYAKKLFLKPIEPAVDVATVTIDLETDTRPILIAGPTASGKSGLALMLAERLNGVVINADALQVYDLWQVLTARPDASELARAPHRLYGHVPLGSDYSVGHWLAEVAACLAEVQADGLRPIIVGGTGLYFQALTQGLADIPAIPERIRHEGNKQLAELGASFFVDILREEDPVTYSKIDINNPARTQRAWEVLIATGRGLAAWHADTPPPLLRRTEAHCLNLRSDTDWINARIDRRFDQMIAEGALEECRQVLESGWDPEHPSCQAIGAKELIAHLQGEMDLDDAIERAKIQTRQYAKRQRTWFRSKMRDCHQLDLPLDPTVLFSS
jgi:tRNA dimethylallyltransferase